MRRTGNTHVYALGLRQLRLLIWRIRSEKHVALFGKLESRSAVAAPKRSGGDCGLHWQPRVAPSAANSVQSTRCRNAGESCQWPDILLWHASPGYEDRKSTRLNSSH